MEQLYDSEDLISQNYDKIIQQLLSGDGNQLIIIEQLTKIQKSLQNLKVFSSNEDLNEILCENLKYLQLPYYMAESFNQIVNNRINNVNIAKSFYLQYLKLMKHYKQIDASLIKQWKNLEDDPNYEAPREEKMNSFKQQKELQNKLNYLQKCTDESVKKDFFLTQLQISIMESLKSLKLIQQETKILEYQESIKKDPQAKEIHDHKMKQPVKPLQTVHIPKLNSEEPLFFSQQNLVGLTNTQIAQEAGKRVFQPGHGQPTQTMEQSADIFIKNMEQQKHEDAQKVKEDTDSENEDVADRKNLEKRAWDDWKDDNEKGAGNKNR